MDQYNVLWIMPVQYTKSMPAQGTLEYDSSRYYDIYQYKVLWSMTTQGTMEYYSIRYYGI